MRQQLKGSSGLGNGWLLNPVVSHWNPCHPVGQNRLIWTRRINLILCCVENLSVEWREIIEWPENLEGARTDECENVKWPLLGEPPDAIDPARQEFQIFIFLYLSLHRVYLSLHRILIFVSPAMHWCHEAVKALISRQGLGSGPGAKRCRG